MIRTAKWFERRFVFDLPLWMYPNVLERLRGTPARLADRLASLQPELLTETPAGGGWTIQEHAGHLLDLEPLGARRLEEFLAGKESLSPADLKNRKTDEADHNSNSIENILRDFRRERLAFVARLEELDEATVARSSLHPRLNQPMRLLDLLQFIAEHDDHHLARITELAQALRA